MERSPINNQYSSLNATELQESYMSEGPADVNQKRSEFWVRNDFLNLSEFVRDRILKVYYITLYVTVALFIAIIIAFLFPVDWSDNSSINVLMYKVDQWIKLQNVP